MYKKNCINIMLYSPTYNPYIWLVTCADGGSYYVNTTKGHPEPIKNIIVMKKGELDFAQKTNK